MTFFSLHRSFSDRRFMSVYVAIIRRQCAASVVLMEHVHGTCVGRGARGPAVERRLVAIVLVRGIRWGRTSWRRSGFRGNVLRIIYNHRIRATVSKRLDSQKHLKYVYGSVFNFHKNFKCLQFSLFELGRPSFIFTIN